MTASADPSQRFLLPHAHPYLANLAALWAVDPDLAAEIERLPDDSLYPVSPARDGNLTVSVGDDRPICLHSRYRPLEEAARQVDPIDFDKNFVFFFHGFGLGYHAERVFDKASTEALLFVFEPDLRLLKTTFWHRDLSKLLASRRLRFLHRLDKSDLFNRVGSNMALLLAGHQSLRLAPSLQLHPDFHNQFALWVDEYASYARTSVNTLILNGRRTAENIARNIGWYLAAPGIARLKSRYAGKPAVIVSAGPSLRKNRHLLKGLESRACIIAVQTTLQPLLEMGVEPHFVTSLDYHEISSRFFEKLPPNLRVELVAEPKATHVVLGLHPGPVSLLGNDYAERLLHDLKPAKPTLQSGATVAHLAFYLAEHLGCDPVIFLGQDLGFSDGLCYAPGTSYEDVWRPELSRFCTLEMKQWEQIVRERHILRRIEDHQGRPMYTEERLFTYLQQFERDFLQSKTRIIDATEGGARKRGAESMPFADAIAQFCSSSAIERPSDHPGLDWSSLPAAIASLQARRAEALEIQQIADKTFPLLEQVRDCLEDQHQVAVLIGRIDELRGRMNDLSACYELIVQLTQASELERFHRDRAIAASRSKGLERQRRQVSRDIQNCRAISAAAAEFIKLMDDVIAHLHAFRPAAQGARP